MTTEQLNTALAGRYSIDRQIGQGGMATVYLARDVRHNRPVALKVLKPDLGAVVGPERFLSEIQVTANLQHPNLLPLFDSGEANGLLFYVMPYIEGESLRARLDREKQLPIEEALHIATAIASALDYAHRHGVIHRDLKPENVLMHDGQPLVADFGIALAVSNAGGNRITQTGLSLGTPQYMSPEQATGDRTIDARSDIYSLGALTYEMLVGEAPHTGTSSQAIIARVLTEKPRSIRASRPNVAPHVEAAVDRALEKLPADRWATAKEFSEALNGARPVQMSSAIVAPPPPSMARARVARVREIAAWVVASLGVVVAVLLATRHPAPPVPARFVVELPESVSVINTSAYTVALSHDGTQLAVLGEKQGHSAIYLRRLDDPVLQLVRGTEGGAYPSFSPDGRSLLFWTGGVLKIVPTNGGTPQTIADSATNSRSGWGTDGRVVYVAGVNLSVVSSDGGNRRLVARPDTGRGFAYFRSPSMLPGNQYALVSAWGRGGLDSARIGVVSLRDGAWTDLGIRGSWAQYDGSGHILFAHSGGLVLAAPFSLRRLAVTGPPVLLLEDVRQATAGATAFSVAENGTVVYEAGASGGQEAMYVVDRHGVERQLKSPLQMFKEPRVSPDGRRIVVNIGPGTADGGLWIYEIGAGTLTRLTPDSAYIRGEWSRDGSRVVYVHLADSEYVISRPWDGSGPPTILARGSQFSLQEISVGPPHGLSAVRRGPSAKGDIWLAPSDSLGVARAFIASAANETTQRVSPDGKVLAYASNETGRFEVYLTPIPGPGPRVQVSVDGGTEPAWSRDGGTLFYRGPTRMMAAAIGERPSPAVTRRDSLFLDVYRRHNQHTAYDVFPNGNEFLMTRGSSPRSTIYVIVNWQQLARVRGAATGDR